MSSPEEPSTPATAERAKIPIIVPDNLEVGYRDAFNVLASEEIVTVDFAVMDRVTDQKAPKCRVLNRLAISHQTAINLIKGIQSSLNGLTAEIQRRNTEATEKALVVTKKPPQPGGVAKQ
jgi:hypothetical protein